MISYSVMLVYVIATLGRVSRLRRLSIELKASLSIFGTFLVLGAITSAIGIFGYVGLETTLIIFQILPFLVIYSARG